MILGTISAVDADNGLQLIIDGEDTPTTKKYNYMASYVPSANDRVLVEEVGGSYVIIGKIISEVESSGIVREAQTAENADNAAYADSAANATSANTADVSNRTKGFDSSVSSDYGTLVSYVSRSYNSQLGTYIVTDVALSNNGSHSFVYK